MDTVRRGPSTNQEVGYQPGTEKAASWSGTSSFLNCEKINLLLKPVSLWCFILWRRCCGGDQLRVDQVGLPSFLGTSWDAFPSLSCSQVGSAGISNKLEFCFMKCGLLYFLPFLGLPYACSLFPACWWKAEFQIDVSIVSEMVEPLRNL